jgi:hypothetical protein
MFVQSAPGRHRFLRFNVPFVRIDQQPPIRPATERQFKSSPPVAGTADCRLNHPLHSSTNVFPVSMSMNVIVNQLLVNYRRTKSSHPSTDFALCGHKSAPVLFIFPLPPQRCVTRGRGRQLDLAFLIRRHKAD